MFYKKSFFEIFSICLLCFSFLLFMKVCYYKFVAQEAPVRSFSHDSRIYHDILEKYNACVLNVDNVEGKVLAYVQRDGFDFERFYSDEPYVIEEIDDKYLIHFNKKREVGKKIEKALLDKEEISAKPMSLGSVCYIDQDNWCLTFGSIELSAELPCVENVQVLSINANKVVLKVSEEVMEFLF